MGSHARVIVCRGPRAAEARLLAEIESCRPRRSDDLWPPVRVVVPSRSLRLHVLSRLVRHTGRPVAGVVVQTLHGLAREVLTRCGTEPPGGDAAFEIFVRRVAGGEAALVDALEGFEDGLGVVTASVRDLLDAGLTDGGAEALLEALGAVEDRALRERAEAVVRTAAETGRFLADAGLLRSAEAEGLAAARLAAASDAMPPTRELLVHGYADATGVSTDLLQRLMWISGGTMVMDRPSSPGEDREDVGACWADRLQQRMGAFRQIRGDALPPPAMLGRMDAADREDETRRVSRAIRSLLEAGVAPEEIGVVARDLTSYLAPLERHLDRAAIPYSAVDARARGGDAWRRLRAVERLVAEGQRAPVEVWLAARHGGRGDDDRLRLHLALRNLGVQTLEQAGRAVLRPGEVRLAAGVADEDEDRKAGMGLPRAAVEAALTGLRRDGRLLESWPSEAPVSEHVARTRQLLEGAAAETLDVVDRLRGALPVKLAIDRQEWLLVLRSVLDGLAVARVGGEGGGVQLLDVTEARSRTFRALFVVGCNRDVFPRVVRQDPLLPDRVRSVLCPVLPDLPLKGRGWSEERYLFAQLGAAASDGVIFSSAASHRGRELPRSSFVDRLAPTDAWAEDGGPWPAIELAIREGRPPSAVAAALAEGRIRFSGLVPEVPRRPAAADLAEAKVAVVDAVEDPARAGSAVAFSGRVGSGAWQAEHGASISLLEGVARCPWQAFVHRILGVRPLRDPLVDIAEPDPLLVGLAVHGALERVAGGAQSGGVLEEVLAQQPEEVEWPSDDLLEELLLDAAGEAAAEAGVRERPGIVRMIAARAGPYLEVAREVDWCEGPPRVLGAEARGAVLLPEGEGRIRFRADRVDAGPVLVDYKTGAGEPAKTDRTRRKKLLCSIAEGERLQAAAYADASGGCGRYVFLKPAQGLEPVQRVLEVGAADAEAQHRFRRAVEVLLTALREGRLPPRVEDGTSGRTPQTCSWCRVREACRRDDSGFRRRLVSSMESERDAHEPTPEGAVWWMGRR